MKLKLLTSIALLICLSCENSEVKNALSDSANDLVFKSEIVTSSYVGNGVQWGGYDILESWTGSPTLTDSDWNKLYKRIRFMHPSIVRIMVADGWNYLIDNQYNSSKSEPVLIKILNFCQQEGLTVILGEWGHNGDTSIDQEWLEQSTDFLQWLVVTKGYSCIRYFNMVNEPNGSWSTINGNYSLWKNLIEAFYVKLTEKELDSSVKVLGPDVAVWTKALTSWIYNTKSDLSAEIGAYDIHTYPTETTVRDGSYQTMIKAYKSAAPASSDMLMTELGFKYGTLTDLGVQNALRIAADEYTSDDSNMFVYDAFYGIDMADALIQNMLAGYAGVILWNLDDAMYNSDGSNSTKLKRWGFWNILGAEKFENAADEDIRPWFYPMSLMCRYFPQGTSIHSMTLPPKVGLRAVAGEYDGKYTIAIVNSNTVKYTVNLKMEKGLEISGLSVYKYQSGKGSLFTGALDTDGFAEPDSTGVTYDLRNEAAKQLDVPAQSFCLITNMDSL